MLLAVSALAQASISQVGSKSTAELDVQKNEFAQQKQDIIAKLADGKTYSEISSQDRGTVRAALDRIEDKLNGAGGVEGLTMEQKVEVFNDQETVNTLLTKAGKDSRLVCKRETTVSSRLPTTQCLTVAERKRVYEEAQNMIRNAKIPMLEQR
ncbi:MAG: hypothetical protein ABWY34_10940 [Pseudoxanthomonas sp.]